MYEMVENRYPYKSLLNPSNYSEDFRDFISKCITAWPENRASAEELLKVPKDIFDSFFFQYYYNNIIKHKNYLSMNMIPFIVYVDTASIPFEGT
jgi:serine/threonine protein kinase